MTRLLMLIVSLSISQVILGCASGPAIDPFADLQPPTNPDYGVTPHEAVRIGYFNDPGDNIALTLRYIAKLRTADGEKLKMIWQAAVDDPLSDPEGDSFLGLPLRGGVKKGGILDSYMLVSESGSDTLILFVDIYNKAPLSVPVGYGFVTDSVNADQQ